jgi:hypothetical protein
MVHLHVSALELFITGLYMVIFSFIWRTVAQTLGRSNKAPVATVGQAMAVIL